MPKPSSQRTRKAQEACREAVRTLERHREFDQHQGEESIRQQEKYTNVTAYIRFTKSGREIFRNPPEVEDHDFPVLVGTKALTQTLKEAARKATLKMTRNVTVYIAAQEKGWVEIGYQFVH